MTKRNDDLFCPVDLADWIEIATSTGVPCIPAEVVADLSVKSAIVFDHPGEDDIVELRAFYTAVRAAQEREGDWTMRWSSCVCADMKAARAAGREPTRRERMTIEIDDFRAYEMVTDFPRPRIAALIRPYLDLEVYQGYPVEYRVFVQDDDVVGVSNYYPQRDLPDTASIHQDVSTIVEWTRGLVAAQKRPMLCPQADGIVDTTRNTWSVDYVRTTDGRLSLIEGGPPSLKFWGSHTCCFDEGGITGVALASTSRVAAAPLP